MNKKSMVLCGILTIVITVLLMFSTYFGSLVDSCRFEMYEINDAIHENSIDRNMFYDISIAAAISEGFFLQNILNIPSDSKNLTEIILRLNEDSRLRALAEQTALEKEQSNLRLLEQYGEVSLRCMEFNFFAELFLYLGLIASLVSTLYQSVLLKSQ